MRVQRMRRYEMIIYEPDRKIFKSFYPDDNNIETYYLKYNFADVGRKTTVEEFNAQNSKKYKIAYKTC